MSRLQQAFHNDLQALGLLRDELKLQAHLFKAEARDQWQELEGRWQALRGHAERLRDAAEISEAELELAGQLLVDSLKSGYQRLRQSL